MAPRLPRSERSREGKSQRRARAFRREHALIYQSRDDAAGLPFAGADDRGSIAARKFAAVEQCFENRAGFRRQPIQANFFFGPQQDACAQLVGLHQGFHEGDLIDADA